MAEPLHKILSRFRKKRLAVWGDLILDEYIYTTTGRVSREAPVIVTEFEKNEYHLGGAGNVVMNILSLGATPVPFGFIGHDHEGKIIKGLLSERGIRTTGLVEVSGFTTPIKSRILSGGENTRRQQVLRIDTLPKSDIRENRFQPLQKMMLPELERCDGLVVSDYLSQSVQPRLLRDVRTAFPDLLINLDSRRHLLDFADITVATPNEPEIKNLFPDKKFFAASDFLSAGQTLLTRLHARGILLKRGHQGMIVFEKGKKPAAIDIYGTSQIVDVTGAGDTVLAVLSLSLACGATLADAARLASIAGGIVVMKEGAYPIRLSELLNACD